MQRIFVITGTDTGVGKTLLTSLLAAHLVRRGVKVAALKPISSGHRGDARLLRRALNNSLALETINPWHFRAPIAPLLAARAEKRAVRLRDVTSHIHAVAETIPRPEIILVEGAGGLLSPLGEDFSTRELIVALKAEVVIVGANKLGVVNQLRLTIEALPAQSRRKTRIVLMRPARPDRASPSSIVLLKELLCGVSAAVLPHFVNPVEWDRMLASAKVRGVLNHLLE